jgi:hypothetical protein
MLKSLVLETLSRKLHHFSKLSLIELGREERKVRDVLAYKYKIPPFKNADFPLYLQEESVAILKVRGKCLSGS